MPPSPRVLRLGLLALGASVGLALACFELPGIRDYYACAEDADCGTGGFVCDDGVCCREREDPVCMGRALDGGLCLDGGVAQPFFEDRDEDGFGNPQRAVYRCTPPRSFIATTRSGDCNDDPTDGGRFFFPGALEQCDDRDHDCDGIPNNGRDGGLYYRDQDNDGYGDPARSATYCAPPLGWVANREDCAPEARNINPDAGELCNGIDDNCVQGVDEKPGCGGPVHFIGDPTVVVGARHLNANLGGQPGECLKDKDYGELLPQDTVVGNVWSGTGINSHVFWAESDGGTWDLVHGLSRLRLFVTFTTDGGAARWVNHFQPVVLICGKAGFLRLVHVPGLLYPDGGGPPILETIELPPPDGGSWVVGSNSTPNAESVLRQVQRIEVLVQPATPTASFRAVFQPDFGLP